MNAPEKVRVILLLLAVVISLGFAIVQNRKCTAVIKQLAGVTEFGLRNMRASEAKDAQIVILAEHERNFHDQKIDLDEIGMFLRENYKTEIADGRHNGRRLGVVIVGYLQKERAVAIPQEMRASSPGKQTVGLAVGAISKTATESPLNAHKPGTGLGGMRS